MNPKPHSALVIAAHGSTENEDSSAPTYRHADTLRSRGCFGEVACCFWKEEPGYRDVFRMLDCDDVYVVPNFISEGYFSREIIPREMELSGRVTIRGGKTIKYCDPVGTHASMTRLLLHRAAEVAPEIPASECSLIIVGHGTALNANSAKAVKEQAAAIGAKSLYGEVLGAYMEEPPLVEKWDEIASNRTVIVVPFFISDGLHSYQDIPVLLGMESDASPATSRRAIFRKNPYHLRGRTLYYSSAVGTDPLMADAIVDQVEAFDRLPIHA